MFDIIVNPTAGKGMAKHILEIVEKTFQEKGIEYQLHLTEKVGHATEYARELTQTGANLIVLGGDGTFNEVLNGIVDFDNTVVGFIPAGTGNDYVKATRIPTMTPDAIDLILGGKTGYIDYIDMGDKRCLNIAGAGMDVDVLVKYANMKLFKGKIRYKLATIHTAIFLKNHKVRLTIDDGEPQEMNTIIVSLANGIYIGGGMPISPNSNIADGEMDVVIVHSVKKGTQLPLLLKFLKGKHLEHPSTESIRCKHAKLEVLDDGKTQADGEIMDRKVLDCRLVHGKLRTYVK